MSTPAEAAESDNRPLAFGRLGNLVGYQLRRAQLLAFDNFAQAVGNLNITPAQLAVLLLVEANPGIKQTVLAAALNVDRSTMVRMVDRCEEAKLVKRGTSRADRRIAPPTLTARGRALIRSLLPKIARHEAQLASSLSTPERETLLRLLRKLNGFEV